MTKHPVAVFYPDYNPGNTETLRAFAEGCEAPLLPDTQYQKCDVMVIFGLVKNSFPKSHRKADLLRAHRGPVVVVERGFVRRDDYCSVGLNGINGAADHCNRNSPGDRWAALGVELRPWVRRDGPVLVVGQVPWDVTVQHTDHPQWCRDTVRAVRRMGYEPIFRPHPKAMHKVDYGVDCPLDTGPLPETLDRVSHVVTWCSNTAVDAAVQGVPVIACDRMSMASPVAGKTLLDLFDPYTPDRLQWANDLAYTQWTRDEMRAGKAWEHIKGAL